MIIQPNGNFYFRDSQDPNYDVELIVDDVPNCVKGVVYVSTETLIKDFYWDDNLGEYVVEYDNARDYIEMI